MSAIPVEDGLNLEMLFDEKQKQAIDICIDSRNRIASVTGSAGTGKTTIIKTVAEIFEDEGRSVICCAPTGKAARRIREATGLNAITIHKLLEFPKPHERDEKTGAPLKPGHPKRQKFLPIEYEVVLCDEYAMVNHELNRQLIDALRPRGLIRCFGDINQLPPIEDYKIKANGYEHTPFERHLKDFPSVTLDKVYRQGEGSGIFLNARGIVKGMIPTKRDDFRIVFTNEPTNKVEEYVWNHAYKYKEIENQIIVTGHKGWIGTYELNQRVQCVMNPDPAHAFDPPRHKWHVDKPITLGLSDKVVCTENTYDTRDYFERYAHKDFDGNPLISSYIDPPDECMMLNGEIGFITEIYEEDGEPTSVVIDFGDREVTLPYYIHEKNPYNNSIFQTSHLKNIDLGYVLTTHKCQGSEFEEVIYVLNKSSKWSQGRKNLYTAITRARKHVTLITDSSSLNYSMWKQER
jgi:exodeoxyribonuclease V alpha subunit